MGSSRGRAAGERGASWRSERVMERDGFIYEEDEYQFHAIDSSVLLWPSAVLQTSPPSWRGDDAASKAVQAVSR